MSFITKRERVFNEYDLFDLPARNEGKLKAYASCTDARAWSHFGSDQTEHLVDLIKRNNVTCRTKYIPTDVIVNTLMVAKNAEIGRLKRKIEEFEQMLAAYDQLDLTSEQKVEIANAHSAIKAANKELDELYLDLDLSGFTEGVDSEAFETGKSRGDEPGRFRSDEIDRPRTDDNEKYRGDDIGQYRGDDDSGEYRSDDGGKYRGTDGGKYRGANGGKYRGTDSEKYQGDDNVWIYDKQGLSMTSEKSNQIKLSCPCDASTNVLDPRIQHMQDTIISKDAKLNAMKNTIAVMENDVCEPYCIYAHIYTALEKIFGILCQNDKYKLYLNLMTAGKDTRCIDIKGKILFKLKVLEKFSLALIAPCSQEAATRSAECTCYRAEINQDIESTFVLTSSESQQPSLDNKRAHLVADIMENEEMKEILSRESGSEKTEDEHLSDNIGVDNYDIETENLKRIKNLQTNYDDLVACYENLKHDKNCLQIKCQKYEELENDYEMLRNQLREYNLLWTEKEHYRKRSEDLDSLKEQYLILTDETTNLETQLKAESEINHMKTNTIEDLRNENISLDKKFNEALIAFEKEKNVLQCKLKEFECKVMCQEQQIKSLSTQIDRLLEQDKIQTHEDPAHSILLIDEIESLKDQIKNLKNALFCYEDEKHTLQDEFQEKLKDINELKMAVEDWKSIYEKTQQRNNYLENCAQNLEDDLQRLIEENRSLSQELEEKTIDVYNKSQEIKRLTDEIKKKNIENDNLFQQLSDAQRAYDSNVISLENERKQALHSLDLARQESQELLKKVKDYNETVQKQESISKTFEAQTQDYDELKNTFLKIMDENKNLQMELKCRENNNSILLEEIERLRDVNNEYAVNDPNKYHGERQYRAPIELTKKESGILENFENLSQELHKSRSWHESLLMEKKKVEMELQEKTRELANTIQDAQMFKKESQDLSAKLTQSQNLNKELLKANVTYQKIVNDNQDLQNQLSNANKELNNLLLSLNNLREENYNLLQKSDKLSSLEKKINDLQKAHDELVAEKNLCQYDLDNKIDEINNLNNIIKNKVEENTDLLNQIKCLENDQKVVQSNLAVLQNENIAAHINLDAIKRESTVLIDKVKVYENLEEDFEQLKRAHDQLKIDKERLQNELNMELTDLRKMALENNELRRDSQTLLRHSENLEKLLTKPDASQDSYSTIKKEIEDMKQEQLTNHRRITELLDKLDESEKIIANLSEDILTRNDKIAILENYINELEDEVRRLHDNLAEAMDAGEEIQKTSYEKIDRSLKNMEAHHSRATHNMKMELVKLQNENSILENRLSATKLKTKESAMDNQKYLSKIMHLQNEKEIIVTDIKQLELESVGDSNLSPKNCSVEEILVSLDRIRKTLEAKNSRSNVLEQTLLKVQTSSQLLLSEAKGIVEKEKQKNLSEKEEAIRDKLNMQKELEDQKAHLEKQISQDKAVIKDLEVEILNQKLLFEKINKSTEKYISELKEELRTFQNLYKNSMAKVSELQENLLCSSEETNKQRAIIEKTNLDLEHKSKEIAKLQEDLDEIRNKPSKNIDIQVSLSGVTCTASQTEEDLKDSEHIMSRHIYENNLKDIEKKANVGGKRPDKPIDGINISGLLPKQKPHSVNEVQILTANIEPTFDFVKNNYLNYKIKQLSLGRIEQYSILKDEFTNGSNGGQSSDSDTRNMENPNIIDIYNKQSLHSNSSKAAYKDTTIEQDPQSPTKSSFFTRLDLKNDSFITDIDINKYKPGSSSEKSTDKDFFLIYKDSEPNKLNKVHNDKERWNSNRHSEILVESMTVSSHDKLNKYNKNYIKGETNKKQNYISYEEEEDDTDSVKPKLHINIPRVVTDSLSLMTSEADKKSWDSYTMGSLDNQTTLSNLNVSENSDKVVASDTPSLPTLLNDETEYKGVPKSLKTPIRENKTGHSTSARNKIPVQVSSKTNRCFTNKKTRQTYSESLKNESHHKLSRVDADVFLIKPKNNSDETTNYKDNYAPSSPIKSPQDFGLQYILNTVQQEIEPNLNAAKMLRKTRSDERFNQLKPQYIESSNSPSPPLKLFWSKHKTDSSYSCTVVSKTSEEKKSQSKSFVERSVMAKMDNTQEYEVTINNLTKALENIEKDYKNKIEVIKAQYDNNIKSIFNEHNQGVINIQNLHEETLQDIIKVHENEVENLRTMSIEAMRKADKLEKENRSLKSKIQICSCSYLSEELSKLPSREIKKQRKSRIDTTLTKTNVEAFNVKPKSRSHGPCTCSLDVNISDTIRNIFEQVDVEQRKMAEHAYMKYIVEKIITKNVEALDTQELSFLHLKVCRTWKMKLSKEGAIQKGIDTLEHEVMYKQRSAHEHIAELDRRVAEQKRKLQEAREAVFRLPESHSGNPDPETRPGPPPITKNDLSCCCSATYGLEINERQSAGDLLPHGLSTEGVKPRRIKTEINRAVLAQLDVDDRRQKKLYNDEPPTRLRRSHGTGSERTNVRTHKK